MPRNQIDRENGLPLDFPGKELVSLDMTTGTEPGIVTVYASIPPKGFPSIVRLNLFSELSGTRQHFASAFFLAGQAGVAMTVTGYLADSWHVLGQATAPQQDVVVGLVSTPCCASPEVVVKPEALTVAFGSEGFPSAIAPLFRPPIVPMGEERGAANAFTVAGTGTVLFPTGSRLTHWIVEGSAALAAMQIHHPPGSDVLVTVGTNRLEGFPDGLLPVSSIDFQALTFGLFEFVV